MRTRIFTLRFAAAALAYASLALAGTSALGAEYWLRAAALPNPVTMPDGGQVVMWGYANCSPGPLSATCGTVTVPGPALTVPPGDTTLTVHLLNSLTVPTSLVINGLIKPMSPVWDNGSTGSRPNLAARVRSFDAEAAPNNGTQADYTWGSASNPVKPGTYLYQSGTQPQVQVQMGLYGAVTKNAVNADATTVPPTRAQAYPGIAFEYDNQATLLYSEIDPALHTAVATGQYGPATPMTSTIDYAPKYFLINGQPFPSGTPVMTLAGTTLLRLLNAGLTTHVPMIQGAHWTLVAEDGKPYPYPRTQYTVLLPAAKTTDVLLTPDSGGAVYAIMDRRLSLSNNGMSDGGMLAFLKYSALGVDGGSGTNTPPIAVNHAYPSVVGVTLNVGAGAGLLVGASDPDSLPLPIKAVAATGTTTLGSAFTVNSNGSFSYTPKAGLASGADEFNYRVTDGNALSAPATVTIGLTVPGNPSIATLDEFTRRAAPSLGRTWAQQSATVTSNPDIGVSNGQAVANSTSLGGLAIWNAASFGPTQGAGFVSGLPGAKAYLVLKATGPDPKAPVNYIRVGCEAGQVVVYTMMGGSNVSAYVKQATLGNCGAALSAVVDAKGLVTAFVGGSFVGGVQLPDVAAWKGGGRIGIQITTPNATVDNFAGGTIP